MNKRQIIQNDYKKLNNAEIIERLTSVELKLDFMMKRMQSVINEEIDIKLSEKGFKEFLFNTTSKYIQDNFKDIMSEVINKTLKSFNKRISEQAEITKDLTLSIDKDIKFALRRLDLSYSSDVFIEKYLREELDKHFDKIMINNKNSKMNYLEGSNEE